MSAVDIIILPSKTYRMSQTVQFYQFELYFAAKKKKKKKKTMRSCCNLQNMLNLL